MSEKLSRAEKAEKLEYEAGLHWHEIGRMTCEEINNLYSEHFEKITKEDFEGFEKCLMRLKVDYFVNEDGFEMFYKDIKKELGL